MTEMPSVCVLAGGAGTRLGDLVEQTPKPLLTVAGEPFLFHQLRLLARFDVRHVVLCVGYRGTAIEETVGHERFGIRCDYSYDGPKLAGTLGALRGALRLLPDRFLVLYGDTYLRIDYGDVVRVWEASGLPALMTVLRNDGRWGRSNALLHDGRVVAYDKYDPTPEMAWIDYGLGGFSADVVRRSPDDESDLSVLQGEVAASGELCGYEATERFFEIGTPSALAETERFLRDSE